MSEYISFYLKNRNGDFLPFACFCRSNVYYQYASDYVPHYDVCGPLSKSNVESMLSDVRSEMSKYHDTVEKYEKELSLIASMNNSVEDKLNAIADVNEGLAEVKEIHEELKNCEMFFTMLLWMIDEADNTKYYKDEAKHINPDEYIYAGIECKLPNASEDEMY